MSPGTSLSTLVFVGAAIYEGVKFHDVGGRWHLALAILAGIVAYGCCALDEYRHRERERMRWD